MAQEGKPPYAMTLRELKTEAAAIEQRIRKGIAQSHEVERLDDIRQRIERFTEHGARLAAQEVEDVPGEVKKEVERGRNAL